MKNDEEMKKRYHTFNINQIKNIDNYKDHIDLLECYVCHNISIYPYICNPCKISICHNCFHELKISTCINCNRNNLVEANGIFCEHFKDTQVQCLNCQGIILYPELHQHKCQDTNLNSNNQINNFDNNKNPNDINRPNENKDEIKYLDGIIHLLCKNCEKYVPNSLFETHICVNKNSQIQQNLINSPLANLNTNQNLNQNKDINNFCNMFQNQKLISNEGENILSKKYSELKIENRMNKLENILADFMSNFTKTFSTNPNILDLTNAINNLNNNIIEMQKFNKFSFCFICKTPKRLSDICPCNCKFCEKDQKKSYCINCIIVCPNCNTLISKNCKFICSICKVAKCPICEEEKNILCLCLDNRICSPCHNFNIKNNPNLTVRSLLNSKESHRNCKFVKCLSRNIFIAKIFDADFKIEICFSNSITQIITLNLIKNKVDLNSKIMQIAPNDTLRILKVKDKIMFSALDDIWEVSLIYYDEKKIDFAVLNLNLNPERLFFNKLDPSNFENLPNSSEEFGNINTNVNNQNVYPNANMNINYMQSGNNEERNKIKWIYYEKI